MRVLIVPAAGRGSRLGTTTPKPLVHVNGQSMLDHLADLYNPFVGEIVVVAHPSFRADIEAWAGRRGRVSVAEQASPTGMLDAVLAAAPHVARLNPLEVWITWADQIGVLRQTLDRLAGVTSTSPTPALALPTVMKKDPYIHFERDRDGRIARILQRREGDEMPAEGESDMGVFALSGDAFATDLVEYAAGVAPGAGTGERNFVPFVPWLAGRRPVVTIPCTDPMEAIGINTPEELAAVAAWLASRGRRA